VWEPIDFTDGTAVATADRAGNVLEFILAANGSVVCRGGSRKVGGDPGDPIQLPADLANRARELISLAGWAWDVMGRKGR
jgi:hypothetical protein